MADLRQVRRYRLQLAGLYAAAAVLAALFVAALLQLVSP